MNIYKVELRFSSNRLELFHDSLLAAEKSRDYLLTIANALDREEEVAIDIIECQVASKIP